MKSKNILLLFSMLCIAGIGIAQTPQGFNYQAVVRDNSGKVLSNENITVKVVILSGQSASKKVYEETHSVTTTDLGHFNVVVGSGSTSDNFSTINWSVEPHHVKIEIDQGSGFAVMGTVQLQSVPYAMHSATADNVKNLSVGANDLTDVNTTGAAKDQVLKWNGTEWVPANDDAGSTLTGGTGITINSGSINATSDNAMWNASKIQGRNVDSKMPASGQALKWDGSRWSPADDAVNTYQAGNGIQISGNTISAQSGATMWNADKLRGISLSSGTPSKDQVLQFDGSEWTYKTISSGGGGGALQWDTTGNDIFYSKGNVGINNNDPATPLSVRDSITHSTNGFWITTDNYMYGGSGSGARYVTNRSVLFGQGGLSNMAAMNICAGDILSSGGEAIGTYSQADGDGSYNIASFNTCGDGASSQTIGSLSTGQGTSSFNIGTFTYATRSHSNTNYGIYAIGDSSSTNYAGYFDGDVNYTGNLTNTSDVRFKRDIEDISSATSIVSSLRPTTYYFKKDGDARYINLAEGKQYGFIAQEIEKVLPAIVHDQVHMKGFKSDESIEYKAVNYIALIPILTKAIQEQQESIEALEQRIQELEASQK